MPSYQKFIDFLDTNTIKNCPVTAQDVKIALFIGDQRQRSSKEKPQESALGVSQMQSASHYHKQPEIFILK